MHQRILRAEAVRRAAELACNEVIASVQAECPHDSISACPPKSMNYFNDLLPIFVCTDCGAYETGYYAESFARNLTSGHVSQITREEVYALRKGKDRAVRD